LIVGSQGLFDKLAITTFYYAIVYASGFLARWKLRRAEPGAARPYRAMRHPWSTLHVVAVSVLFLGGALYADPTNSLWALLLVALAGPIHRPRLA
jgi:amino acid transporter